MQYFFSWFDPFFLFGRKVGMDHLTEIPLECDETLRTDPEGSFYCLKVPEDQSFLWDKLVFWTYVNFNQSGHLNAINQIIALFEERILAKSDFLANDFPLISQQISCLKSLKNDYGYTFLKNGNPSEVDQKLQKIEEKILNLFEKNLQIVRAEHQKQSKEALLHFFNEAQAILTLLEQESWFGMQESRRILTVYSDDIPKLFNERLNNIQARLLLAQDLNADIEKVERGNEGEALVPNLQSHFNSIQTKLNQEVNNLETEILVLINNLKNYFLYHPEDLTLQEYFGWMGIDFARQGESLRFDPDLILNEKLEIIQAHLNKLAA